MGTQVEQAPTTGSTLPARLWVVGPPGSGKSTLAQALATVKGVEATHLDDLHWLPDWIERPYEEMRQALDVVAAKPSFVIDGNYTTYRQAYLDRIQLTIWLDFPLRVTLPRLVRRGVRRSVGKQACCNGNYESLRRNFFHRESLLLWALTTDRRRRKTLSEEFEARPHVRLRSQREADLWLDAVGTMPQSPGASLAPTPE